MNAEISSTIAPPPAIFVEVEIFDQSNDGVAASELMYRLLSRARDVAHLRLSLLIRRRVLSRKGC